MAYFAGSHMKATCGALALTSKASSELGSTGDLNTACNEDASAPVGRPPTAPARKGPGDTPWHRCPPHLRTGRPQNKSAQRWQAKWREGLLAATKSVSGQQPPETGGSEWVMRPPAQPGGVRPSARAGPEGRRAGSWIPPSPEPATGGTMPRRPARPPGAAPADEEDTTDAGEAAAEARGS